MIFKRNRQNETKQKPLYLLKGLTIFMKHFNWFVRKQYAVQLFSTPKAGLSDFFQCLFFNFSPAFRHTFLLLLLFLALSLPAPFHSQLLACVSQREGAGCKWWAQSLWHISVSLMDREEVTNNHSNTTKVFNTEEMYRYIFQTNHLALYEVKKGKSTLPGENNIYLRKSYQMEINVFQKSRCLCLKFRTWSSIFIFLTTATTKSKRYLLKIWTFHGLIYTF